MQNKCFRAAVVAAALLTGCGRAAQDLSYTNPQWKSSVTTAVSFPLAKPVTLRVGLVAGMKSPGSENAVLAWLEKKTNINLEFVNLVDGDGGLPAGEPLAVELGLVGDVDLGDLVRSGHLPDLVPESAFDLRDKNLRTLFVDMLEYPGLTPHFRQAVSAAPRFRDGLLARLSEGDRLYSMGTYDPDAIPFAGVLAYRQDLFDARGLKTDSWDSILRSLRELKSAFPQSHPFGGLFDTIMSMMPSWFGSGYDRRTIVYFDNDTGTWRFGPYDDRFRELVRFLATLYRDGLMFPDMMTMTDYTARDYSNMFMAPYPGLTGPAIHFLDNYGGLTPEGEWNGKGAWVSALPLPAPPLGGTARESTERFSGVGDGWLVYNQSPQVGEAVALLDLLYTDDASKVLAATDFPLKGLLSGPTAAYGQPPDPARRYFLLHDAAVNRLGVDMDVETGLNIPFYDPAFRHEQGMAMVELQSLIESGVASFITGQRSLDQYDAFKEELRTMGADSLLELYREHCLLVDPEVLAGGLGYR